MDALAAFTPATRAWFERAFAGPDAGAGGGLAGDRDRRARARPGADRLGQDARGVPHRDRPAQRGRPGEGLRLLYVSPLKALNYDVERNLRGPLAGLGSTLTVGVRTGDTPSASAARCSARRPTS